MIRITNPITTGSSVDFQWKRVRSLDFSSGVMVILHPF